MSMEKTADAARGRWKGILTHFGMDAMYLDGKHHPCPFCGGKDRFRFTDKEGKGTWWCQCRLDGEAGLALVSRLLNLPFKETANRIDAVLGIVHQDEKKVERTDAEKMKALSDCWKHCKPIVPGQPPWIYLESRCGPLEGYTRNLRYHPALRYGSDGPASYPALVAGIQYADGTRASIHKTFLTPDGRKANVDPVRKVAKCVSLEGASVRLGPVQERLGIGEGIETCISASKIFGLPVWAGLSANGILSWVPPEGVKSVLICADNDANYTGQSAAYEKAKRLKLAGYDVEVVVPLLPGLDWNDVWLKSPKEQVA